MTFKDDNIREFINDLKQNKGKSVVTLEYAGIPFEVDTFSNSIKQSDDEKDVIHTRLAAEFVEQAKHEMLAAISMLAKSELLDELTKLGDAGINKIITSHQAALVARGETVELGADDALEKVMNLATPKLFSFHKPVPATHLQKTVQQVLKQVGLENIHSRQTVAEIMSSVRGEKPQISQRPGKAL